MNREKSGHYLTYKVTLLMAMKVMMNGITKIINGYSVYAEGFVRATEGSISDMHFFAEIWYLYFYRLRGAIYEFGAENYWSVETGGD